MKQAPPWKITLPFLAFCALSLSVWYFSRQATLILAAAAASVMGVVWTYGAWRIRRDEERLEASPEPARPAAGYAVVLTRARKGNRFSPTGFLLASDEDLIWIPDESGLRNGSRLPLAEIRSPARVAHLDEIDSFESKAGFLSGEVLTLFMDGKRRQLQLLDPEGLTNLLAVLPDGSDVGAV